jgi:hypothetical protein
VKNFLVRLFGFRVCGVCWCVFNPKLVPGARWCRGCLPEGHEIEREEMEKRTDEYWVKSHPDEVRKARIAWSEEASRSQEEIAKFFGSARHLYEKLKSEIK